MAKKVQKSMISFDSRGKKKGMGSYESKKENCEKEMLPLKEEKTIEQPGRYGNVQFV